MVLKHHEFVTFKITMDMISSYILFAVHLLYFLVFWGLTLLTSDFYMDNLNIIYLVLIIPWSTYSYVTTQGCPTHGVQVILWPAIFSDLAHAKVKVRELQCINLSCKNEIEEVE